MATAPDRDFIFVDDIADAIVRSATRRGRRNRAEIPDDGQAGLLRSCFPAPSLDLPSRAGAASKQSHREFPSSGATTRVQDAMIQVSSIRAALPQYPCRRPQHIQSATTPRLTVHVADLSSRNCGAVARCRHSSMTPDCLLPSRLVDSCRDKAPWRTGRNDSDGWRPGPQRIAGSVGASGAAGVAASAGRSTT